ncbi:MAG TPA: YdcF family protein [Ferruginibacter sp.]|nr:YdcF family protein [Ferruginibacter sp.]
MFFILSKIFAWLIFPLSWIILILLWRVIARSEKRKKELLITAIAIFLIFTNVWVLKCFATIWDIAPTELPANEKYSCGILLGGFSSSDDNGNGYFNLSADRFIQAVKLYKEGKIEHVLVTGGNGNLTGGKFREGVWVKGQLLAVGIPDNAILIENNSRNTLENAEFSKKLLDSANLQPPYVLVTSAFHMRRASWIFKKEGMDIVPFSANYLTRGDDFTIGYLLPQIEAMDMWAIYIKEVIGYFVYKMEFKRLTTK